MTKKGVEQLCNFTLGDVVPAATFAASRNVAVTSKQTLVSVKDGAYVCIKGVEFTGNEKTFEAKCIAADGKSIKILIDSFGGNGTEICEAKTDKTGSVKASVAGVKGLHDLYFVLQEGVELISWSIK